MVDFTSTKPNRDANRTNATAEILGAALKTINPVAAIPSKLAQGINSTYMIFRPRPKPHEKVAHGMLAAIAFAQIGILIGMLFTEHECGNTDKDICKGLLLTDLLYQGVLILGWAPTEIFKDQAEIAQYSQSSNGPNVTPDSPTTSGEEEFPESPRGADVFSTPQGGRSV